MTKCSARTVAAAFLAGTAQDGRKRRVLVDVVFETRQLTVKTCPRCRTENRGRFPNDMPGALQYGHGVVAFATHPMAAQMVPQAHRADPQGPDQSRGRLGTEA